MKHTVRHRSNTVNRHGRTLLLKRPVATHSRLLAVFFLIMATLLCSLAQSSKAEATMAMTTGKYVADGNDNLAVTNVGFRPDVVIVKAATVNSISVISTVTMASGYSKKMDGTTAVATNLIKSFTSTGFTVGTDNTVNKKNNDYYINIYNNLVNSIKFSESSE